MTAADPHVGLVLAGGGARGAYEAGALSVLLPALEHSGERPGVLLGTSVGAVNTAWLAAMANLDAATATASMLDRWRSIGWSDVLGPLVSPFELSRALVYLGELLGVPGAELTSLLDTSPQAATLKEQIDFAQLARNVETGALQTAAVVATSYATGDSVVFHDSHGGPVAIAADLRRGICYAPTPLSP
jgi:NTE family protein